ncbi:MAG: YfhO family protein [Pirellulales bacterium]|nr:YfhO family protein [Pirellulales bacterium]
MLAAWLWFVGALVREPGNLFLIDTSLIDVPFRVTAARMIRQGDFPFWISQVECGFPLFADGQTGILYPPFALYLISPTPAMHDFFMALHYLGAGLAMYLYLMGRRVQPLAGALGAAIFLGGPVLLAAHVVPGIVCTIAWIPLALWCIDRGAQGHPAALWWCAAVNGLVLLAGVPNTALFCILVEAVYLISVLWRRGIWATARSGLLLLGVGASLAAVQLLPTYDYYRQSHREAGIDWATIETNCVRTPREIATMGVCRAVDIPGSWPGYALVASVGTAIALTNRSRRAESCFWLALAIFGLLIATGTPLLRLWYLLPVVSWFRWPMLYVLITHLAACVLIGLGADVALHWAAWLLPRARSLGRLVFVYGACSAAILAACWNTLGECQSPPGFYELGSAAILKAAHDSPDFRLLPLLHGSIEGRELPYEQRFWSLRRQLDSAIVLAPDYSLLHGVSAAVLKNQIDAVTPRAFTELITAVPRLTAAFLRVAAITHVSDIEPVSGSLAQALEVQSTDPAFLYTVREPQPRAWLVGETKTIPDAVARLRHILVGDFDCRQTAVVETPDAALPVRPEVASEPAQAVDGEVELTEPNPGRLVIRVRATSEAMLVVADRYAPEIAAEVDGQPAKLVRVNHAFRGVRLPAGEHLVEMRYVPTAFWLGAAISALAAVVTVSGIVVSRRR